MVLPFCVTVMERAEAAVVSRLEGWVSVTNTLTQQGPASVEATVCVNVPRPQKTKGWFVNKVFAKLFS